MRTLTKPQTVLPRDAQVKSTLQTLNFELPDELEAGEPPEARGLARDGIRLMVSHRSDDRIDHMQFRDLPGLLDPGDVLVTNTSGTLNAALAATRTDDGAHFELHLSTHLPGDIWIVEVRQPEGEATRAYYEAIAGTKFELVGGASATLHTAYRAQERGNTDHVHLWIATLDLPTDVLSYLAQYGFPIRYSYVKKNWPLSTYQTIYATEPGSAEMPSAGRPFTIELLERLTEKGIGIAPLVLHTGIASLEEGELPHEEFYRVSVATAKLVNAARSAGKRIVAVGTTVVRALETVADADGIVHPGEGWTRLILTPQRGVRMVDGLLTGLHEPESSHLGILEALVPRERLRLTYDAALAGRYLWHEFGDLHLILP